MHVLSTYLCLVIVPFLWGTNIVLGKVLVGDIPPLTLTAVRFTVAAILLLLILRCFDKKTGSLERKHYLYLALMGVIGIAGFNGLLYAGLQYTTSTNGAVVNALYPAIASVLSTIFMKEKLNGYKLVGLVFSLSGVVLITINGSIEELLKLHFNPGDILVLVATTCWAIYSITGQYIMRDLSPLVTTTYSIFFSLCFLYPAMFLEFGGGAGVTFSWPSVVAIIYLGVMAIAAQFLWNKGVQAIGSHRTAYFYNLTPVFTAIMASLFLKEQICWFHYTGGAMVLFGVVLGSIKDTKTGSCSGKPC